MEGEILPPDGWQDWGGKCPTSWLFNEELEIAAELQKMAPLSDWPQGWPAWLPVAFEELNDSRRASKT